MRGKDLFLSVLIALGRGQRQPDAREGKQRKRLEPVTERNHKRKKEQFHIRKTQAANILKCRVGHK